MNEAKEDSATEDCHQTTEEPRLLLKTFRGIPFPALFSSQIEKLIDWKPNPGDIFVVTYPKCGTTWAQFMVWEVLNRGAPPPSPNQMIYRDFPYLEVTESDDLDELPSPRMLKTHLPFMLQPYHPEAKYIYVIRNPLDCCVSYFHHVVNMEVAAADLSFEEFFDMFMNGKVGYGDFFDHVLSWYEHLGDPNLLLLNYEDMKSDPRETLLTIAKFLGDNHYEYLMANEDCLESCLRHTDFKFMKGLGFFKLKDLKSEIKVNHLTTKDIVNRIKNLDKENVDLDIFEKSDFFRKGVVEDWKNNFSKSQLEEFDRYMTRKLKNTDLMNYWESIIDEARF